VTTVAYEILRESVARVARLTTTRSTSSARRASPRCLSPPSSRDYLDHLEKRCQKKIEVVRRRDGSRLVPRRRQVMSTEIAAEALADARRPTVTSATSHGGGAARWRSSGGGGVAAVRRVAVSVAAGAAVRGWWWRRRGGRSAPSWAAVADRASARSALGRTAGARRARLAAGQLRASALAPGHGGSAPIRSGATKARRPRSSRRRVASRRRGIDQVASRRSEPRRATVVRLPEPLLRGLRVFVSPFCAARAPTRGLSAATHSSAGDAQLGCINARPQLRPSASSSARTAFWSSAGDVVGGELGDRLVEVVARARHRRAARACGALARSRRGRRAQELLALGGCPGSARAALSRSCRRAIRVGALSIRSATSRAVRGGGTSSSRPGSGRRAARPGALEQTPQHGAHGWRALACCPRRTAPCTSASGTRTKLVLPDHP